MRDSSDIEDVRSNLHVFANDFQAGQIRFHFQQWKDITIDKDILEMVLGVDIKF